MQPRSIPEYLDHWTQIHPDKRLAAFLDVRGQVRESHSYASFERFSRTIAGSLRRHPGLSFGDRAILCFSPGLDLIAAFVACNRIGLIPTVVGPPIHREARVRLGEIVRNCAAKAIIGHAASLRRLQSSDEERAWQMPPGLLLEFETLAIGEPDETANTPHETLFLQYTSGSTGDPKGVQVSHENVVHNCAAIVHENPVGVSWLPQFHDMGMIGFYLFLIVAGGTTYGFSPADFLRRPVLWLETLSRFGGSITSAPNFGYAYCLSPERIAEADLAGIELSSVRLMMNGAEPVEAETFRRFQQRFARFGLRPQALAVAYGLAENTLGVSIGRGGGSLRLDQRALQAGRAQTAIGQADGPAIELMSCGRPLAGVEVRIADTEAARFLPDAIVGEIIVGGSSKCQGYFNQPAASRATFEFSLPDASETGRGWLRTGDLGFVIDGDLYVCGRIKDVIILRGRNFHANDLEAAVEKAEPAIRPGLTVAFQEDDGARRLVILAGTSGTDPVPDLQAMATALRQKGYDGAVVLAAVPGGSIARTSSGKRARSRMRALWSEASLTILTRSDLPDVEAARTAAGLEADYRALLSAMALSGPEQETFGQLGMDSLALVQLAIALEGAVSGLEEGARLRSLLGGPLLQDIAVAELTRLVSLLGSGDHGAIDQLTRALDELEAARTTRDAAAMRRDAQVDVRLPVKVVADCSVRLRNVLLTGSTGFLGPFLLTQLLARCDARLHLLVRAPDQAGARARIWQELATDGLLDARTASWMENRIELHCGDLAKPRLGLSDASWVRLANSLDAIVHNGAEVDYIKNYNDLKPVNVDGTRALLRLAIDTRHKQFHHISSTIVFGWTPREVLHEKDCNREMAGLDFGYAQTKWVAEQQVLTARAAGLDARIYRPSFVTSSRCGIGNRNDIVLRVLSFMINHRLAPRSVNQMSFLPVDLAAENMARLILLPVVASANFHVTVSEYYNLADVACEIGALHGVDFRYLETDAFVREMQRDCTASDLVFPLLDFIVRSHRKFASMEHKRYCNRNYRAALVAAGGDNTDPSLRETVAGLVTSLESLDLIGPSLRPRHGIVTRSASPQ